MCCFGTHCSGWHERPGRSSGQYPHNDAASPHLLARFTRRASDEKFRRWFEVDRAEELAARLSNLAEVIDDPEYVPAVILEDATDDYLVALARAGNVELLVTGDKGIGRALQNSETIRVASPGELLALIL